jgi:pyrroloquinoline quinone biosynthesis protein B
MALLRQKVGPVPGRSLPIAGIFLTHAHVGHYLGLPFLGREVFSAKNLPVVCTPAMAEFLQDNRPFQHLARRGEIVLCPTTPGLPVDLQGLRVTAFHVQHRNEDADTVGYRIEREGKRVLYIPDFDAYETRILDEIRGADLAFLDATFFSAGELAGRDQKALGHVTVAESMAALADQAAKVRFLHLNHTNPVLDPASPQRRDLEAKGFRIAEEGETLTLAAAAPAG